MATKAAKIASGKVRDVYDLGGGQLALVASDRISAFDVIMDESVEDRGRILTELSAYWFTEVLADLPHHFVGANAPEALLRVEPTAKGRTMVVKKAEMLPVEFIVRARLAGSGWKEYQEHGTLHGVPLEPGMKLGSALPRIMLTPSTKAEQGTHDVNLTREEARKLLGEELFLQAEALSLEVFRRGAKRADTAGLILADTKFELGYIDGTLSLCDEVLTPDSSRFWPKEGWKLGETPPNYDKQILRDWLETQPWDKSAPAPTVPQDVRERIRGRYVEIYERLSGRTFA